MLLTMLLLACPDPTPEQPDVSCPAGEVLEGDSCLPEACGVGTWGNLLVDGDTVYVNAAAAGDGDGSSAAPLTSIQAGVDLAGERDGGLVAVATGAYVEWVAMGTGHDGVTLAGRCKEVVTIDGSRGDPNGEDVPAIEVSGGSRWPEIAIQGVTVTGGTYTGLWVEEATVSVSGSDVRESSVVGVLAVAAEVSLDGVGVYDTVPDRRGDFGRGIAVEGGAALTATGCVVQRNTEVGVAAAGAGTLVTLSDTQVLETGPSPAGTFGLGIEINDGASLTATGCTVEGNSEVGVRAGGTDTLVSLSDTQVLNTAASPDGTGGSGISIEDGAALTATGCTVQGSTGIGVAAIGAGATVGLSDTLVLGTAASPDGTGGSGVEVSEGAALTAVSCTVQGNTEVAVFATGADTLVTLSNTRLLDTAGSPDGTSGNGIWTQEGAALTATGCTVQGNSDVGVFATGAGTLVTLADTQVLDTGASPEGVGGRGIEVSDGAALTATGCTVQANTEVGVFAGGAGTLLTLSDTQVLDTGASPDGTGGVGIEVSDGAALTATGCVIQGNTELGVSVRGAGTLVTLSDTHVLDTDASPDGGYGRGIQVVEGAALTATGCTVEGNHDIGVFAAQAGTLVTLSDTGVLYTLSSPDGTGGAGVGVQDGAQLTGIGCTVTGNTGVGVFSIGAGTLVTLSDTEVLDTSPSPDGTFGPGIAVQNGAALTATGITVQGNTEVGVLADGSGTEVDLVDTRVMETRRGRETGFAVGLAVQEDAHVRASGSVISETEGAGLYVSSGGRAELDGVQVTANRYAGVLILGGSAELAAVTIEGTVPDSEHGGGFGVYAYDGFGAPSLNLVESTVGPHDYAAVWLDGPGSYTIERNTLSGSAGLDQGTYVLHGNAVFAENGVVAWNGAAGLRLVDNTLGGAAEIGVLLDGSSAELDGNSWSGNSTDVRQQGCDGVRSLTDNDILGVPIALVCPVSNVMTAYDMVFTTLYLPEVEVEE